MDTTVVDAPDGNFLFFFFGKTLKFLLTIPAIIELSTTIERLPIKKLKDIKNVVANKLNKITNDAQDLLLSNSL